MHPTFIIATLSLLQTATESVSNRLTNADPSIALQRFVGYPAGARWGRFAFNPKFWAKGIDFSCVSPWNSAGGSQRAGTAISKRHIVFAKHFPLGKGVRIVFVGEDGGVCPARIEATKAIDDTDIMIGSLDYELTPNIKPAKILPEDYSQYIGNGEGFPVATFNQNEKVFMTELNPMPTNRANRCFGKCHIPTDEKRSKFREVIAVGDSGNPAFILVGNEAVLLYCLTSGGCGRGPLLHIRRKEIQRTMDELCPGYTLECFDFSRLKP